jgi:hypothetical protein
MSFFFSFTKTENRRVEGLPWEGWLVVCTSGRRRRWEKGIEVKCSVNTVYICMQMEI